LPVTEAMDELLMIFRQKKVRQVAWSNVNYSSCLTGLRQHKVSQENINFNEKMRSY
jgi:hypothetical protein